MSHPARHDVLETTVVPELKLAAATRPKDFRRVAPGSATRYGAPRQLGLMLMLYRNMLRRGVRIGNVKDIARTLDVSRKEAAAMLAVNGGPEHGLDAVSHALIKGSVCAVDACAPVPPQVLVIGAPNSPTPGVHKTRRVFGVGPDGHQRLTTAYLSSVYGAQDALGYSIALGGWVRPSSLDDEISAAEAGRLLSLYKPTTYSAMFTANVVAVVDETLAGRRLPIVLLDGRRDRDPNDGVALESVVDSPVMQPDWERDVRSAAGDDHVVLVAACDPDRPGGGGLAPHLVYQTAGEPSERLANVQFEAGLRGDDPRAANRLAPEWTWLPTPSEAEDPDGASVMAFDGTVIDTRTGGRSRLFVFLSHGTGEPVYMLMPFAGARCKRDPLPGLDRPRAHLMAKADIARVARVCVGPSLWVGTCRRAAMTGGRQYFDIPSRDCTTRELAFAIGSHLRLANLDFPTDETP